MTERKSIPAPNDRRVELRVKIKSLALEAREIRKQELRHERKAQTCRKLYKAAVKAAKEAHADGSKLTLDELKRLGEIDHHRCYHQQVLGSLTPHRREKLRREARHSQIALAFILGRPYAQCERPKLGNVPSIAAVHDLVVRFGLVYPKPPVEAVEAWMGVVRHDATSIVIGESESGNTRLVLAEAPPR